MEHLDIPLQAPLSHVSTRRIEDIIHDLPEHISVRGGSAPREACLGAIRIHEPNFNLSPSENNHYLNLVETQGRSTNLSGAALMVRGLRCLMPLEASSDAIRLQIHTKGDTKVEKFLNNVERVTTPISNSRREYPEWAEQARSRPTRGIELAPNAFNGLFIDFNAEHGTTPKSDAYRIMEIFKSYLKKQPKIELAGSPHLVVNPRNYTKLKSYTSRS